MTVKEFAKYTIDNLSRASLVNAFNISEKLDNPNFYELNDGTIIQEVHDEFYEEGKIYLQNLFELIL